MLTNIAGPLLVGVLYTQFGAEAPYWLGALILLLGVGAALLAAPAVHVAQAEPEAAQA